jgi:hypothetical protein
MSLSASPRRVLPAILLWIQVLDEGMYIDVRYAAELKAYAKIQLVGLIIYNHTFPASEDQTMASFNHQELGLSAMQLQIHSSTI